MLIIPKDAVVCRLSGMIQIEEKTAGAISDTGQLGFPETNTISHTCMRRCLRNSLGYNLSVHSADGKSQGLRYSGIVAHVVSGLHH